MADAFFLRQDGGFASTELTRGPWSPNAQHGSPPAAMLMHAVTRAMRTGGFVARIVVDFLRVVPVAGQLTVRAAVVSESRQTQRVRAVLVSEDREVAQATALVLRQKPIAVPEPRAASAWPPPETLTSFVFPFFTTEVAYHRAVDVRIAHGTWGTSPIDAWLQPIVPLIAGEIMSPLERVMAVVDAQNGIAPALPIAHNTFINPDLTVYFSREPRGEWIGCGASSVPESHGVGLVQSELRDEAGVFGRALQSLLLDTRS
jgi:hypothetical protein